MKIGVIGAGFTGLASSYKLLQQNHEVIIFEKESYPGGLAIGFKKENWDWSLEKHYHHWFTNDYAVLNLAKEIGYEVIIKRPKTSVYIKGSSYQLDSPLNLLKFPQLSMPEKLRMAFVLALLRYNPFWKMLEGIKAADFLKQSMGKRAYRMLWEPQLINKFGNFINDISLSWFWARIKKRTSSLAYPKGGFLNFANQLSNQIKRNNGEIYYSSEVLSIQKGKKLKLTAKINDKTKTFEFDKIIVTLPSFFFVKIVPDLPFDYQKKLTSLKGLGAINLVMRLKKPFLKDGTYWLSVCETNEKVMAVVEHTNFMDKKYYDNEHLVYLGNYLPFGHKYFEMTSEELLKEYDSFLKKLNPDYKKNLIGIEIFKAPFAQPIIPTNYSKMLPPFETPIPNLYLANIQQVYPWDRGTNYSVELGEKIASLITK